MTGRTHDLAAFTALNGVFVFTPLYPITLATVVVAIGANFIGGLAPDLDKSTSTLWKKVRGGNLIGPLIAPILGGHRLISHSLIGLIIAGIGMNWILGLVSNVLLVDMFVVWCGFMIGLLSHLITDAMTKEGIPLFFPFPFDFGIPPVKAFRIKTGKMVEKSLVYPGLMILNGYWFFTYSDKYLDFLRNYLN